MERAERELLRKHALELKQQPKSLKVMKNQSIHSNLALSKQCSIIFIAKRITNS